MCIRKEHKAILIWHKETDMAYDVGLTVDRLRETFGDEGQTEIGHKIHYQQSTISKILNKKQEIPVGFLCSVADVYHVSVDWLLGLSDVKTIQKSSDEVSYSEVIDLLVRFRNCGAASIERNKEGQLLLQVKDPIVNIFGKKALNLCEADRESYRQWREARMSVFDDKPLLSGMAWNERNLEGSMLSAETEADWAAVYEEAKRVEDEYIEMMKEW